MGFVLVRKPAPLDPRELRGVLERAGSRRSGWTEPTARPTTAGAGRNEPQMPQGTQDGLEKRLYGDLGGSARLLTTHDIATRPNA